MTLQGVIMTGLIYIVDVLIIDTVLNYVGWFYDMLTLVRLFIIECLYTEPSKNGTHYSIVIVDHSSLVNHYMSRWLSHRVCDNNCSNDTDNHYQNMYNKCLDTL